MLSYLRPWLPAISVIVGTVLLLVGVTYAHNRHVRLRPEDMQYMNRDGSLRPQPGDQVDDLPPAA